MGLGAEEVPCLPLGHIPACLPIPVHPVFLSVNLAITHPLPFQPFPFFSPSFPACQASWLVQAGFVSPEGSPLPCVMW